MWTPSQVNELTLPQLLVLAEESPSSEEAKRLKELDMKHGVRRRSKNG